MTEATYEAITQAAERAGISACEWLTQLIRVQCPDLPPQQHHQKHTKKEKPKPLIAMTRADVESALAPRVVVKAATSTPPGPKKPTGTCAHCGTRAADHYDEDGYAICTPCSTTFGQSTWGTRR
jgi:hypothetical protein